MVEVAEVVALGSCCDGEQAQRAPDVLVVVVAIVGVSTSTSKSVVAVSAISAAVVPT